MRNGVGILRDPLYGDIFLSCNDVKLLSTEVIQRLRHVSQRGPLQWVYPGAVHTRFEHSIGVLYLATRIAQEILSRDEYEAIRDLLSAAAIFHDSGCAPFHRALEERSIPLSSHEELSVKLARETIDNVSDIDTSGREVANVLARKTDYLSDIVRGTLDADRLDYLRRDALHTGITYGMIDTRILSFFTLWKHRLALHGRAIALAETVLFARYMMKAAVYDHRASRSIGAMLAKAVEYALMEDDDNRNPISAEELASLTDSGLLRRLQECGRVPEEIVGRIRRRQILSLGGITGFKQLQAAGSVRDAVEISKEQRLNYENEIARKMSLKTFEVIIDKPPIDSYTMNEGSMPIVFSDGRILPLSRCDALAQQIAEAYVNLWAIRLYVPMGNEATAREAFERVTGITLFPHERASIAERIRKEAHLIRSPEEVITPPDIITRIPSRQRYEQITTQRTYLNEIARAIEQYKRLVRRNAQESDFQRFFEKNPAFLEPRVKVSLSKKSFGGEGYPDFLLILNDLNHLLVEIEKPSDNLFTKKGNPTSKLSHAQQQIIDYLKWANEEKEFLRKRGCPNISADNTKGLVVIGKSSDLTVDELRKLEGLNATVRSRYEVKTFDKIFTEYETILANLEEMAERWT